MTKAERDRLDKPPSTLGLLGYLAITMMVAFAAMVLHVALGR